MVYSNFQNCVKTTNMITVTLSLKLERIVIVIVALQNTQWLLKNLLSIVNIIIVCFGTMGSSV
jgi:hypothetical protein